MATTLLVLSCEEARGDLNIGPSGRDEGCYRRARVRVGSAGRTGPRYRSGLADAWIGRGRAVVPMRSSSTAAAQARPSAIAHTISD